MGSVAIAVNMYDNRNSERETGRHLTSNSNTAMILLGTSTDQCQVEGDVPTLAAAYFDDDDISRFKRHLERVPASQPPATDVPPSSITAITPATAYFDDDMTSANKRVEQKLTVITGPLDNPPPYEAATTGDSPPAPACHCATPSDVCATHGHDPQINLGAWITAAALFPPALLALHKKKRRCRRCSERVEPLSSDSCCFQACTKNMKKKKSRR